MKGGKGSYGSRRIREETALREHARTTSVFQEEQERDQALFLCATARCDTAALRLSPGDGRRAEELGHSQGTVGGPDGEASGGFRGGSPNRVRQLRRQHPGGELWGGIGDAVGSRDVGAFGRRGRGSANGARRPE